ncbi:MAG: hypothetical protein OHK0039_40130 [Bacteroidia bacterium]
MNKRLHTCLCLLAALCWGGLPLLLPAQSVQVRAYTDTSQLRIGEALTLTLSVLHDPGTRIDWPVLGDTLGPFEVLQRSGVDSARSGGRSQLTERLTLMIFDSGQYLIPPIRVSYIPRGDQDTYSAASQPLVIDVLGVAVDTTQQLRDIKAVMPMPYSTGEVLRWVAAGLLLLGIVGGIWWWIRWRKRRPVPVVQAPPPPRVPPHETAMRELARLEALRLWQQGDYKTYYVDLTHILRRYMEEQFGFPAMESITGEIIRDLSRQVLVSRLVQQMRELLEMADLAKFAKFHPTPDANLRAMDIARTFVKDTSALQRPEPSPAPDA